MLFAHLPCLWHAGFLFAWLVGSFVKLTLKEDYSALRVDSSSNSHNKQAHRFLFFHRMTLTQQTQTHCFFETFGHISATIRLEGVATMSNPSGFGDRWAKYTGNVADEKGFASWNSLINGNDDSLNDSQSRRTSRSTQGSYTSRHSSISQRQNSIRRWQRLNQ